MSVLVYEKYFFSWEIVTLKFILDKSVMLESWANICIIWITNI